MAAPPVKIVHQLITILDEMNDNVFPAPFEGLL
jgi:hypothetical protein